MVSHTEMPLHYITLLLMLSVIPLQTTGEELKKNFILCGGTISTILAMYSINKLLFYLNKLY